MEMDPLRPKSTPLDDVTLWFEFLLKPSLLVQHLKKPSPDPSPIDLIQLFLSVAPDMVVAPPPPTIPPTPDVPLTPNVDIPEIKPEGGVLLKIGRKQLALKILAVKVAAHLNFNLDIFDRLLPLEKQLQLLTDLITVVNGKLPATSFINEVSVGVEELEANPHEVNFALILFHRFVLRAQVKRGCQTRSTKMNLMVIPGTDPTIFQNRDDMLIAKIAGLTQTSIDVLNQVMFNLQKPFKHLTFDCFSSLDASTESANHKFELAVPISKHEVRAQIFYDFCLFYVFTKNYKLARENVIACRDTLKLLKQEYAATNRKEFHYCSIDEEELDAYLMACGVFEGPGPLSLIHKMNDSIMQQYQGIAAVFREDNIKREIPMIQRKVVELDIEGSISTQKLENAREMYLEIICLNVVRYVIEDSDLLSYDLFAQRYKTDNDVLKAFFQVAAESFVTFDYHEKNLLKTYCLELISHLTETQLTDLVKVSAVFSQAELEDLRRQKTQNKFDMSTVGSSLDLTICEGSRTLPRLEQAAVERQLITSSNPNQVRKLLVKLAGMNPTRPLWSVNPTWVLPDVVRSTIMSLPRGFLQDFSYILVGKAKEMMARDDFATATTLLTVTRNETQRPEFQTTPNVAKLGKLVQWELLFVAARQCLEEWPKKTPDNNQGLVRSCKACLMAINETVGPRLEILECVCAVLLNLGEFSSVILTDRRYPSLDLYSVFASAVLDIDKSKGQAKNKVNKETWDLVLPVFLNSQQSSRRGGARDSRDSPSLPQNTNLYAFFKKLRDPTIISIVLSLLCRIHNVLKDEQNLDINAEYMFLWPTSVPNPNGYNLKAVDEAISSLLSQAFSFYPDHVPWVKIRGDLEFASANYEPAMKNYVTSIITSSEYCTLPLQKPVVDDFVIRRMIKCSMNLGCYMQAAVLCQFFDETDYAMAFKSISEKSANSSDAMDAYYACIWDPTLLEFIVNLHSKKGEHKRKLQALSFMGLLELNANNNDEIRAQAASTRKIKFLRALANQYMF